MGFDPVSYLMGKAAGGGGGGGGGSVGVEWNEPIMRNWDFSNPVNTRGNSSYTNTGSGYVAAINGWRINTCTQMDVVSGGIKIVYLPGSQAQTNAYYNFPVKAAYLDDKKVTLSVLIDNMLYSTTITLSTGTGRKGLLTVSGIDIFMDRTSSVYGIGFKHSGEGDSALIQAIKLELGETQTLAYQDGGIYKVKKHQSVDEEKLMLSFMSSFD